MYINVFFFFLFFFLKFKKKIQFVSTRTGILWLPRDTSVTHTNVSLEVLERATLDLLTQSGFPSLLLVQHRDEDDE